MPQPIPRRLKEKDPSLGQECFNTLLVDGSNLLEISFSADKKLNSDGAEIGGIYQFLLQMKQLMKMGNFRYVYVFWDGSDSGVYRSEIYREYKANRDKSYSDDGLSDYMKEFNAVVSDMQRKIYSGGQKKPKRTADEKESFHRQRDVIMRCLDELFVRQCVCDGIEADDFIGYYVKHKKPEENIVIFSNDRDLSQLLHKSNVRDGKDDVILAIKKPKRGIEFLTTKNHLDMMGYDYRNVVLKKVICGDQSDNIKGVKGVGEKTLLDNFPEMKSEKVTLDGIISKAKAINEARTAEKKKPLKWCENIVNGTTDGSQGDRLYEINTRIIDLSEPIMTAEAENLIDSMMYAPMDPEGRSLDNLYGIILEYGIDDLKDADKFADFFTEFKFLMDKEIKNKRS